MRGWLWVMLCLIGFGARAEPVTLAGPGGLALKAQMFRPAVARDVPAIVALHGCGGPFGARDRQWREKLLAEGHILLFPDSFGSRGLKSQCQERNRLATAGGLRRQDALAAAQWLVAQPGTPQGGVVLLGWSDGGSTVLAAGEARADLPAGLLRGLVAFYPGCTGAAHSPGWQPAAPLLILMGEADDWTPAAPCHALAAQVGARLSLTTYAGAYHDFDAPVPVRTRQNIPSSQNADHSVHAGDDPAAAQDALRRVSAFLAGL